MTERFEIRKVAVLGAGKMGATLLKALEETGTVRPEDVTATAASRYSSWVATAG